MQFLTINYWHREGGIWTRDPLLPRQVRYQAALLPENDFWVQINTPEETWTLDPLIRSQMLWSNWATGAYKGKIITPEETWTLDPLIRSQILWSNWATGAYNRLHTDSNRGLKICSLLPYQLGYGATRKRL